MDFYVDKGTIIYMFLAVLKALLDLERFLPTRSDGLSPQSTQGTAVTQNAPPVHK